jgi:hypothetical protein
MKRGKRDREEGGEEEGKDEGWGGGKRMIVRWTE